METRNIRFPKGKKVHTANLKYTMGMYTLCGQCSLRVIETTDPVTCKACLKIMETQK